jgi:creatinine amidohydrolase
MSAVRWGESTAPELRELAERGAVALWPAGATEQHGTHLVTGFDLAAAEAVCSRAAQAVGPLAVVLPGIAIGASDHWLSLGATLSLRAETFEAVVGDVARSVGATGFGHLLIVNGHAGNVGPLLAALGSLSRSLPVIEVVSYWTLVDADQIAASCRADDGGIGHAGEVETSIGLYLGEGLVRADRMPAPPGLELTAGRPGSLRATFLRVPRPLDESPTGVYGDPGPARAELGELVIEQSSAALTEHIRSLVGREP